MLLTATTSNSNLTLLSEQIANGISSPFSPGQRRPLLTVVFLCPSKIVNTGIIRVKSFMVGCVRQLSSWSFLDDTANLAQSAPKKLAVLKGGLKSMPGETAMRTHTQKLTSSVSEKQSITTNPNALDKIATEIFRTVGTCNYVDKNICNYAELRGVQIDMLITDAQRLIDACNAALAGMEVPS